MEVRLSNYRVDHMLFASDSPWCDQKETYDLVNACLDESEKEEVLYKNALRLLQLDSNCRKRVENIQKKW